MLRFCDKEVGCAEYNTLNRNELRLYFLSGHLNDIVCVYDDCRKREGYRGKITFHSLIQYTDVYDSIQQEYVILDKNIWRKARNYFMYNNNLKEEGALLPVLDEKHRLICFAYQDITADRQLRMLRELDGLLDALNFRTLYPDYDSVTIYDCNELAYSFAEYLRKQNLSINLVGMMWKYFKEGGW